MLKLVSSRPEVTGIGAEGSQGQQERSEVSGQVKTANTQDSFECV